MNGLHQLGLPDLLVEVWRLVNFVLVVFVITGCWIAGRSVRVSSRKWLFAALGIVALRTFVVQLEQWDADATIEILVIDTVYLALATVGIRAWASKG